MMINNIRYKTLNSERDRSNMLDNLKATLCIVGLMLALFTIWVITL